MINIIVSDEGIYIKVILHFQAYSRVVEVNASQKRLLGRYYRVAFFGPVSIDIAV